MNVMNYPSKTITKEKSKGRFYTPEYIVDNILDLSEYYGNKILKKHVIDNSCGNGAFLVRIVERYCQVAIEKHMSLRGLREDLSKYIHGIEIDEEECGKCIENVNAIAQKYGVGDIAWDIICADTLTVEKYNGKMDFVLGNPPYIRVHNLDESMQAVKGFSFAQKGMTDLYIVFYEIGIKMLNAKGVLGYITPSSFFNSIAGKYMRQYFLEKNLLTRVVDLKHYQAFDSTTYTTIIILSASKENNEIEYFGFNESEQRFYYVDTLTADDYYIAGNFYFATKRELNELRNILSFKPKKNHFTVKNGFATLADKFFIGEFSFTEFIIPIIKASTGKCYQCIFPYKHGALVPYEELTRNQEVKEYYERSKSLLQKRSLEKKEDWYGFGRSQGIHDLEKCKYSINTLLRTIDDIKLIKCDKGVGVYSGLYILTSLQEVELRNVLCSNGFISYISILGKYKSGGYYTFSSKDLKNYLEYKYTEEKIDDE